MALSAPLSRTPAPGEQDARRACADALVRLLPPLMDELRRHMRDGAPAGLSVQQMRLLIHVGRIPGVGLTEVAELLGVTLPTVSVAVQRVVEGGWIETRPHASDARRLTLWLTESGRAAVQAARRHTRDQLMARLAGLDGIDLAALLAGLAALDDLLDPAARTPVTDTTPTPRGRARTPPASRVRSRPGPSSP